MDGYVTIGTKLDTKGLEKDLNKAQRELLKLDSEAERLQEKKIFIELDLKDYYKSIEEVKEATDRDLYLYGKTDEQAQQILEMEEQTLKSIDEQYAKQLQKLSLINAKIKENADAQQNMRGQVASLNEELGKSSGQLDFENIDNNAKKVGNSIGSIVKRVIRWGLALLGVRTALSLLSRSFSVLSQYNEDLANRVESMRLLLATALEPIINWLVNMAEKLLQIIAGILNMLFGIDLYARASQLSANKMAKGFGGASKSAKELKKQLAGFDEMNVLTEPSQSSGGGGGGAGGFNLQKPNWDDWELPSWLKWIIDNADIISGIILGIGGALVALKLGLSPLLGLGIGLIIAGLVNLIIDIIDFIKDPSWEKFKSLLDDFLIDIGLIVLGIGLLTSPIVAIIGLVMILAGLIIRYWDDIKELLKKAWGFVKEIAIGIYTTIKNQVQLVWNFIKGIFITAHNFVVSVIATVIQSFINLWTNLKNGAKSAWEGVKSIFGGITSFFSGVITKIINLFTSIGQKVSTAISGALKGAINGAFSMIEKLVNTFVKGVNTALSLINKIPNVNIPKLKTLSLPRLAKGGIINQPGRGVMVGGAIAGEKGAEGVIPLTDSQQMALLGEAIGKYITINANITNTMNGRVISRELQKIQNSNDFAYNR